MSGTGEKKNGEICRTKRWKTCPENVFRISGVPVGSVTGGGSRFKHIVKTFFFRIAQCVMNTKHFGVDWPDIKTLYAGKNSFLLYRQDTRYFQVV